MKRLIIILQLTLFSTFLVGQVMQFNCDYQWHSQSNPIISDINSIISHEYPIAQIQIDQKGNQNFLSENVRNIKVSRSPQQLVITKDDKYAFIRCFLSNTIELINIPTGEIVKSFTVPSPKYLSLNNDGSKLFVASFSDFMFPPNPPIDDCSLLQINLSGISFLTIIDIGTQEISKPDTLKTPYIRNILISSNDSTIYLVGENVVEYNLSTSTIKRQWQISNQIFTSEIDNKNQKIFLTTIDSTAVCYLMVIDLTNGNMLSVPYYSNGEKASAFYIGMDTLSNRIFVQGKLQPSCEVLVFDAISLNQLSPIDSAYIELDCFLVLPGSGSLFIGGQYPLNTLELDYYTLNRKKELSTLTNQWHTITSNNVNNRLYSFQYGSSENALSYINPAQHLDIIEYDLKTGNQLKYISTDYKYECCYTRTLETTHDGRYIIATNSPENTVSIIELSYESVNETNEENLLDIHPNPTSSFIKVSMKNELDSDYGVEIYNILGELLQHCLKSKSETNFMIELTKYPNGQYFMHINSANQTYIRKIIKI